MSALVQMYRNSDTLQARTMNVVFQSWPGFRCQLALVEDTHNVLPAHDLEQEGAAGTVARVLPQRLVPRIPLIEAHAAPPAAHRVPLLHAVEAGAHELICCRRVWVRDAPPVICECCKTAVRRPKLWMPRTDYTFGKKVTVL